MFSTTNNYDFGSTIVDLSSDYVITLSVKAINTTRMCI